MDMETIISKASGPSNKSFSALPTAVLGLGKRLVVGFPLLTFVLVVWP